MVTSKYPNFFFSQMELFLCSRFESLNIPLGRGLKIKPMLEKWVESIKSKRSNFMKEVRDNKREKGGFSENKIKK